ncbi:MAG: serine hydrolase domain-containing protein [bacterium]
MLTTKELFIVSVICLFLTINFCHAKSGENDSKQNKIVNGEIGTKIDEYMSRLENLGFSGALLVAKDDEIILAKGYGLADRERNIPVTTETVFTIGSITKQFTGAAILKLEMEGKLSVQDPINKYFENVPEDKAGITIHHLLTHSAGLKENYGSSDFEPVSRDEIVRRVLNAELLWKPGTQYKYSNAGYSLLGAIIEIVTGESYEEYLNQVLFKPAGMFKTGYKLPSWNQDDIAQGYHNGKKWGTVLDRPWAEDGPYWNLRANGGIHSTIGDLYKWHLALEGKKILSKEAKQKLFTAHSKEGAGADSYYGYGWAIFKTQRGTKLIAHNGGNGIFAADFRRYVDENAVIIIASSGEMSAIRESNNVARILFGMDYTLPPKVSKIDEKTLLSYAGDYELNSGERLHVTVKNGQLEVMGKGEKLLRLLMSGTTSTSQISKMLNERTKMIIENARHDNYEPLYEALGGEVPMAEIKEMDKNFWMQQEQTYGNYKDFEVVGSYPGDFGGVTLTKINFEHGTTYLKFSWEGGAIAEFEVLSSFPTISFVAVNEQGFIPSNFQSSSHTKLNFQATDDSGVTGLRIQGKDGEVTAQKVQ